MESVLSSAPFLLIGFISFFLLKGFILIRLIAYTISKKFNLPLFLIIIVLIGTMFGDFVWIFKLIRTLFFPLTDPRFYWFLLRISWGFVIVQYQALALFIETLTQEHFSFKKRHLISIALSGIFFFFLLALSLANINESHVALFDLVAQKIAPIYCQLIVVLTSIFFAVQKLRRNIIPRILIKQIKILIYGAILPALVSDFLQIYPFDFSPDYVTSSYTFLGISNILQIVAIYYCARNVMKLRFLNLKNRVQSSTNFNFMETFKIILERLSHVTNEQELNHITQGFFKDSFSIPFNKVNLFIRKIHINTVNKPTITPYGGNEPHVVTLIEGFMNTHDKTICKALKEYKMLIYDELAFSNFYEKDHVRSTMIAFMESIHADLFVPIYEKERLIAYIVVYRDARPHELYSETEYDEMLVFSSYLSNIINLLKNRNLNLLIEQEKELQEELYNKHQEINQYKESIRSFLRNSQQKTIGIIFYKNRRFTFGNQAAKEMIRININLLEGHPLTKALKQIATQVEEYKAPQSCFTKDGDGNSLVLSAIPNLENNNVIITIAYPDISDVLKKQIDALKDPSERDYLLYLETTKVGKLINQLVPAGGETLLQFKIELLKIALCKKVIALDMPAEDLQATVELLHHMTLRETLYTLELTKPCTNLDIIIKLFGINPIFGIPTTEKPLLEQLNNTGTLFIKNIHFLSLDAQLYLSEFIRYGFYRTFKSEQKTTSDVRIICSSHQNLNNLVQEGLFAAELLKELKQTTLVMPALANLPEPEFFALIDGFVEQAVKSQAYKNLLTLSQRDKLRLNLNRPSSLQELKTKVMSLLEQKSEEHAMPHADDEKFSAAKEFNDPELINAARLGKQALKDRDTMIFLWNKFKNQNKIATFLGVNRSSVNRRCKEYNLQ
jgi:transcriptional regulator with PAS, ATPase and Fis domain